MHLRFVDTFPGSGVFASVEFDVAAPTLPPPDAFRVEATAREFVRCTLGGAPVLWSRIDRYWQHAWVLASGARESLAVVPPWRFDEARGVSGRADADRHGREWATRFARALVDSRVSPLHAGTFRLTHLRGGAHGFEASAEGVVPERHAFVIKDRDDVHTAPRELDWEGHFGALVPLRRASPASSARRKAWRKAAREGWLPPILLLWISGLNAYVLLDGHDRLSAAEDEDIYVDALALWRATTVPRDGDDAWQTAATTTYAQASAGEAQWQRSTAEHLNRSLVDAFTAVDVRSRTRAVARRDLREVFLREVGPRLAGESVHPMLAGL